MFKSRELLLKKINISSIDGSIEEEEKGTKEYEII
jgi:hypothetical protein